MAEPLRLLVVGVNLPLETFLQNLLRGLAKEGIHITLATAKRPPQAWLREMTIEWLPMQPWQAGGIITVSRLIFQSIRILLAARTYGWTLWRKTVVPGGWRKRVSSFYLLAPFAGGRWDVVYFPWNTGAIGYLPLFDLGMPVVLSCRGAQISIAPHNPQRQELRAGLRQTFKQAGIVHCVSTAILDEATHLGLDPTKARIIHPAVDINYFQPAAQKRANPNLTLVTTGSLIWRKGYEYALMALRQLVDEGIDVEYHIIGEGPERQRILFTIQDLGLQRHVILRGNLTPENVRDSLQKADVFVLSSLSEGISNAVLEAMACGLPVVTTDCGGMREAVTDGVEGYVVPVRDCDATASALKVLWQNPELRQQMGKAGRQRVSRHFNLEQQTQQWVDLYQGLIRVKTK